MRYVGSMKQKTSITLSEDLLRQLDRSVGPAGSRSAYIERVLRRHFRRKERAEAQARDVEILSRSGARLSRDMEDVLQLQSPWDGDA